MSLSNRNLCPNWIIDYCPIRIPATNPNQQSWFPYKIDLFSIKIDQIRLNSIYFWLKDWIRLVKCQLFNRKRQLINRKRRFISETTIYIENNDVFDVIQPIFDMNRIRIRNQNRNFNGRDDFDSFQQGYRTRKCWLKPIWLRFKTNLNWGRWFCQNMTSF